VVQNALDATPEDGRVWVKLGGKATTALEVGDTGHGMSPEFSGSACSSLSRRTKPAGMGIGAYESFQYVHELGGESAG
jgi:signal transduction histidine kinase